ncbi:hypothetical protein ACJIZ3_005450 [Penstemon smallii]|uniref:CASP-like protein n=1 Tax=Penstemon smallii TaxID=265156 RepID=A0ABD3S4X2_9LAMI
MEALLRILSIIFLVLSACLIGLDSQRIVLFHLISRKASFKDMNALYVLVWIDSAAAVYNLLQVCRCYKLPDLKKDKPASYIYLEWGFYLLDQAAVYVVFAAHSAAAQASIIALTGQKNFQWMKLCDRYTRFCIQIGGALLCGYFACLVMAITSSISAYVLFKRYSPQKFMVLKGK